MVKSRILTAAALLIVLLGQSSGASDNQLPHLRLCSAVQPASASKAKQGERIELAWAKLYTWGKGSTLNICFVGGSPKVQEGVKSAASGWLNYANIHFNYLGDCGNSASSIRLKSQIRIGFDQQTGSWSYIGTLAKSVSMDKTTMNFGWLEDGTETSEYHRVVLHEFGHALGCIHEHQSPNANIQWNREKVIEYYRLTNGWDEAETARNIFDQDSSTPIDASKFDKFSIMEYYFPPDLTKNNIVLPLNTELSDMDKDLIANLYPS
jgi:hypothetical protein